VDDIYKLEARQLLEGGNKIAAVSLLACLVWWIANLFPISLAERRTATPTSRLEELSAIAKKARSTCEETTQKYVSKRYEAFGEEPDRASQSKLCFLSSSKIPVFIAGPGEGPRSAKSLMSDNIRGKTFESLAENYLTGNLAERLNLIDQDLQELRSKNDTCRDLIENFRKDNLEVCNAQRVKLNNFVDELSKQGNLDILGLKINNIHPKWHPLVLVLMIVAAATWLGARRRKIFDLLNQQFVIDEAQESHSPHAYRVLLLTMPWWLCPAPRWKYRNGAGFIERLTPSTEYRLALVKCISVLTILVVMMIVAIGSQTRISKYKLSTVEQQLADLPNPSFSFTGQTITDLLIVSALFLSAIVLFCWMQQRQHGFESMPDGVSRRKILIRAGGAFVAVIAGSMVVPLVADFGGSAKSLNGALGRVGLKREPRFSSRSKKYATYTGPSGWYRNDVDSSWIGHFVKPTFRLERKGKAKHWFGPSWFPPKQRSGLSEHVDGRIKGAGKLIVSKLVAISAAQLPPYGPGKPRLNRRFYSEGIETYALHHWSTGKRYEAIHILKIGISYAGNQSPLNVRLYDLAAGLCVRAGEERALFDIAEEMKQTVDRQSNFSKSRSPQVINLQRRIESWTDPKGKWRAKWVLSTPRKWNGLDI
jgi:hypothetical protein